MLLIRMPKSLPITIALSSRDEQKLPSKMSLRIFAKNIFLALTLDFLNQEWDSLTSSPGDSYTH